MLNLRSITLRLDEHVRLEAETNIDRAVCRVTVDGETVLEETTAGTARQAILVMVAGLLAVQSWEDSTAHRMATAIGTETLYEILDMVR